MNSLQGQDLIRGTYSDLEIYKLLGKCAHLIIEAEFVFTRFGRCENEVSLSLLLSIHNDLFLRSRNLVINIE